MNILIYKTFFLHILLTCFCMSAKLNKHIQFFLTVQSILWYWTVLSNSMYPFLLWEKWTCWNENQVSFLYPLCDNWLKGKREQSNWPLFIKSAFMEAWVIYSHRLTVSTIISPPSFLRPRTCGRQRHQSLPIQVSDTLSLHFIGFCVFIYHLLYDAKSDHHVYRYMKI